MTPKKFSMPSLRIIYYISGHGYGHTVRSLQIIQELLELRVSVVIKSTTPVFLFKEGLSRPTPVMAEGFDVGLHQIDNIRFDLEKTKESVIALLAKAENLIGKEQNFFSDQGISGIVSDIPFIPLARRSRKEKTEIRKDLDLPRGLKIGLIAFSRLDLEEVAIRKIAGFSKDYIFLIKDPLNWKSPVFRRVEEEVPFSELVCAADFVITKPGYGIVADCLSHGTPMIYSDRGEFPEYPILVEGIKSYLAGCFMPTQDLYSGHWGPYLENIINQPRLQPKLRIDGARVAAQRIIEWIVQGRGGK